MIKDKGWEFQWNEHLGYITTCPSNLGSGMRASVHVKLPQLAQVNTNMYIYYQLPVTCVQLLCSDENETIF